MPVVFSRCRFRAVSAGAVLGSLLCGIVVVPADAARKPRSRQTDQTQSTSPAASTPEIRTTASNKVPTCLKPERLMQVLTERNGNLEPRFQTIANDYKRHGDALGIRWDYAFYQMVLETNYLAFKRGDGKSGDVKVKQNNFAGIGATGGGVPGESYPDVSTGVLAQLQHLVAYSGERVSNPVSPRTRENQDSIVERSNKIGRPVTFADLTNRWAADRNYAKSIESVADRFYKAACSGAVSSVVAAVPASKPEKGPEASEKPAQQNKARGRDLARKAIEDGKAEARPKSGLGAASVLGAPQVSPPKPEGCSVMAASFGGQVTLLIRAEHDKGVTFTALDVEGGAEDSMADSYIKTHADNGKVAGRFTSRDAAITHAYNLCDSGKP